MKYFKITIALIIISSCCKNNTEKFYKCFVYFGEESTCDYTLKIDNMFYYPINLPVKYQHWSGVLDDNIINIQYKLLDINDSFHCVSNINSSQIAYRKMEITKIQ